MNVSALNLPLQEHRLDNGLRVVLQPDPDSPLVAVHVMYHVGSKNERKGRTGFAHLFEHLLFQGSENVPREEHFRLVQDAGGTLNGTTWFDRTNYFETLPANELDLGLWLESDRMGFFKAGITQEKLDNQRDVVKNERRQAYENRPYGLALETLLENAYPEGHPYRHPTIGYMEDIDAARLEDVHEFFDLYYGPNNATLVLAGGFDPEDALDRVRKWFGDIPGRPVPPPPSHFPSHAAGERRVVIHDQVQVPRVYLMFHSPAFPDPGFEAADLLTFVLADGKSSRLERELVYERRLAADVSAGTWPTESAGLTLVIATARQGVGAQELEDAIREVLDETRSEGVGAGEVEGAVNRARCALVGGLASVGDRADALAHAAVLRADPGYVNDAFSRYGAVDSAAVGATAEGILTPDRMTSLHVLPDMQPDVLPELEAGAS